jgi:hypothetical protein
MARAAIAGAVLFPQNCVAHDPSLDAGVDCSSLETGTHCYRYVQFSIFCFLKSPPTVVQRPKCKPLRKPACAFNAGASIPACPRPDSRFTTPATAVVCKQASTDVGSTAAAALASALSATWQLVPQQQSSQGTAGAASRDALADARHSGERLQASDSCPAAPAESVWADRGAQGRIGLPQRQRFEVVAQLGRQENLHNLSDPSVRASVRRMTGSQV